MCSGSSSTITSPSPNTKQKALAGVRAADKYGPCTADQYTSPARKLSSPLWEPKSLRVGTLNKRKKEKKKEKQKTFGDGLSEVAYRKDAPEVVAVVALVPQDTDVRGEA
jgi:hypothetical protein